jgi:hypothetical protein
MKKRSQNWFGPGRTAVAPPRCETCLMPRFNVHIPTGSLDLANQMELLKALRRQGESWPAQSGLCWTNGCCV